MQEVEQRNIEPCRLLTRFSGMTNYKHSLCTSAYARIREIYYAQ